jgi:UDP-2-acetamido-3-amino-2,3-dideoxy-glucuronate N-acetyltransferase
METVGYFRHPHALVETSNIGRGTRIWAFAHVMSGAAIGEYCNLCDHVFVESKVRIGNHVTIKNGVALWEGVFLEDRVFVGPNAVFTNDKNPRAANHKRPEELLPTTVREGASIGANVTIVCGIDVGRHAFIGAGAVVTRSVPDYAIVVGNPARQVGYMCECGNKVRPRIPCECGRTFAIIDRRLACVSHTPTELNGTALAGIAPQSAAGSPDANHHVRSASAGS